eukprot:jgi/Ulvmu1/5994/UM026_0118.1
MSETTTKAIRKPSSFLVRTLSTIALLLVFVGVMWGGHIPSAVAVCVFQALMVRELFGLARRVDESLSMPLFRTQQWYFFFVAIFYLYGRFVRLNFHPTFAMAAEVSRAARFLMWLHGRHLIISYWLYIFGFVLFVLTLQQGQYSYQFRQLAWTHLIVFFVVLPTSFLVPLAFEGLVWFFLPCGLIIVNDIMAYLAGKFCGRTPLIKLSPKKTWEGFIGGAIGTMAASLALTYAFAQFQWMVCPRRELSFGDLTCATPTTFLPVHYSLPDLWEILPDFIVEEVRPALWTFVPAAVRDTFAATSWTCMPAQMHALALAAFASIIGPFGGFFASGFKRALGIKDFGDSIPGHGGVTDRFDCQMMMVVFAYLYFHMYIAADAAEADVVPAVMDLNKAAKLRIFEKVGELLVVDGVFAAEGLQGLLRDAVLAR